MKNFIINRQGFCSGVKQAFTTVNRILDNAQAPVYLTHPLAHNHLVNQHLIEKGAILIPQNISAVDYLREKQLGIVVFSAHGSDQKEIDSISKLGFSIVDSVCPFVKTIQELVKEYLANGFKILYYGQKNHQEALAARTLDEEKVLIIESESDLPKIGNVKTLLTCQSTADIQGFSKIAAIATQRFPNITIIDKHCHATIKNQEEIINLKEAVDGFIIISDKNSSNGNKLLMIAQNKVGAEHTIMINSLKELPKHFLDSHHYLGIVASASTPPELVTEIYNFVENY